MKRKEMGLKSKDTDDPDDDYEIERDSGLFG
jgi:hypothetical protein